MTTLTSQFMIDTGLLVSGFVALSSSWFLLRLLLHTASHFANAPAKDNSDKIRRP